MITYSKLKMLTVIAKEGGLLELWQRIQKHLWSSEEVCILRRDLRLPLTPKPQARIPIRTRRLLACDIPQIHAEHPSGFILGVLHSEIPQCYVGVTGDDEICYLQWLISPENRKRLQSIRSTDTYGFADDSVVLEFAYTFRRFRGLGIMGAALADIAADDKRAIWAWTYVPHWNVACLHGCRKAGFLPYRISSNRWRGGLNFHSIGPADSRVAT